MPAAVRLWLPVVVSFLVQVPSVSFVASDSAGPDAALAILLALAGPLALIGARRFPGPVVVITAACAGALPLLRPDIATPYVALAFAIVLGIIRGARLWVYVSVAAAWLLVISLAGTLGVGIHPLRVAFTTLALAAAMGMGEAIRARRERFLDFRRSLDARRMSTEQRERVRIARELHDVLAHSLSQINVQAGVGLHHLDLQPDKAAAALASIKSTSNQALEEVRMVLGILRSDEGEESEPLAAEPDLTGMPTLIDAFRAQGMRVDFVNTLDAESAVPTPVQLALYRICQEALTNVLRHAGDVAASVYLGADRGKYLLAVTDHGATQPVSPLPGAGLLGMRERAEVLGGSLRAEGMEDGGFRVEARIPVQGVRR
jgi:signal transduction histidine kinase